ncbi:MAG: aminotransferase class I/II-fold pyridoxal phosphate-dependent enzyme [Candidatus Heimdallarchaeota archaeon]|nr:aminotransferase class I/II-fold pyridoxal phosphate-dependent enzyme [Candidatus Heimdallarchaeota archaeon]
MGNKFNNDTKKFATKVVENIPIKTPVNPVTVPIYASSTYVLDSAAHGAALSSREEIEGKSLYLYSRWANPTSDVAAAMINKLENGYGTHITSSGMSAIVTSLFTKLKTGDHIVVPQPVYGGTHEVFAKILPTYNIEVSFVDGTDYNAYEKAIQDNTKVLYIESPANPTMSIIDIKEIGRIGKSNGITTMIDSTFASPYNQNPINLGIDVVLHSATKYLGGHSDIIAGSITAGNEITYQEIFKTLKLFGGILSPFDSFLLARGIKTLDVRMERHNKNGQEIAEFLENHDKIAKVHYPGLKSHPQHEIATKQMSGFGGMIGFEVEGGAEKGQTVIENLNTIILAVSLGGVESLVEQASTMTHSMVPKEERLKGGITDGLIRFSVGIESADDLKKDLSQALDLI